MTDRETVRNIVDTAMRAGRRSLNSEEAGQVCAAYGITTPEQGVAKSGAQARAIAERIGYPVVAKIDSPDILHKTDAGGVILDVDSEDALETAYDRLVALAAEHVPGAAIDGVLVQRQVGGDAGAQEVIVGAVTDPVFGKLVAFGLGGVLVEVMGDLTFRLAPVAEEEAAAMLDDIAGAAVLDGVRGSPGVDREALAGLIVNVGRLVTDCPEIHELDLNPVFASAGGACAVDARILLEAPAEPRYRPGQDEILAAMRRIMQPDAVAVIGASAEEGKIGNSVMKNLIDGGYEGALYPIHPKADVILDHRCHASVVDVPGDIDIAIFCIPARFVAGGYWPNADARRFPAPFSSPRDSRRWASRPCRTRSWPWPGENGVRLMGPNIYGYYYTHKNLCATFCTPYTEKGKVALSSQSGGVGMAHRRLQPLREDGGLRNRRPRQQGGHRRGRLADVLRAGPEHRSDRHARRRPEGRPGLRGSGRAGVTEEARGGAEGGPHPHGRPGRQLAHRRARRRRPCLRRRTEAERGDSRIATLNDMLEFARGLQVLPTPAGENILILTGAGGSGVLLSDACVDHGLSLMQMPEDLDAAFKAFIPPFGASGNPVDITGGEPPSTYRATHRPGSRGQPHQRPGARLLAHHHHAAHGVSRNCWARRWPRRATGASTSRWSLPWWAMWRSRRPCDYLMDRDILAYPYTAEKPVAVLGAKYRWARNAGLVQNS